MNGYSLLDSTAITQWPPLLGLGRIVLGLGLGLLIGIERERAGKEIGVRTFALTCLLATLGWMCSPLIGLVCLIFTALLTIVLNLQSLMRGTPATLTTSVCLFGTALIGLLVGAGQTFIPTASALLLVACLAGKESLVKFSLKLTSLEIRSALTLGILAFVIYPLLPVGYVDPWKIIDLQSAWLTVILISTISFVNYILLKIYGARGIAYTGFLGGLVSSTATVAALANNVVQRPGVEISPELTRCALRGMRLANAAMFLRNGVILVLLAPAASLYALTSLGLMLLTSLILSLLPVPLFARTRPDRVFPADRETSLRREPTSTMSRNELELGLSSPFSLRSAFKYGSLFMVITVVSELGQRLAGEGGFYLASLVGGFVSSASTTASAANLAADGKIVMSSAAIATLLASIASSALQVGIAARISHDRKLSWKLGRETGLTLGMGLTGLGLELGLRQLGMFNFVV